MRILCALLCLFATSATAAEPPADELMPEQFAEDLALLRSAIQDVHPGYGRFTAAELTDQQLDALARRGRAGITDLQFYLEVSRILGDLRCDHTLAEVPESFETWRTENQT